MPSPKEVYSAKGSLEHYRTKSELFEIEKELLETIFPQKGASILDLGCGAGRTTGHLCQRGYQVIGADIAPEMIKAAKDKYPDVDFRVMDAVSLDFPDNSFDAVWFSFNGIDHIFPVANRVRALKEILRVLKPGGLFVFSSSNIVARLLMYRHPYRILKYQVPYLWRLIRQRGFSRYWESGEYETNFLFFAASPAYQIKILQFLGFEEIRVHSTYAKQLFRITLKDRWPHYSARKAK